jgi:hypothetical protein
MARARYVLGESDGQTRPAPLLEREPGGLHQQPANSEHAIALITYFIIIYYNVITTLCAYDDDDDDDDDEDNDITWYNV